MRPIRSALPVMLAGALMLSAAACSAGPPPTPVSQSSGTSEVLDTDCLDLQHGGQHLAMAVVGDLHALDPDKAALNADFSAGDDITVEQLAWVLLGAQTSKDADGEVYVWATDRTSRLPAIRSMQQTIFESSGSRALAKNLDLGRTRVAGLPAETVAVASKNGDYDAWTFTSGKTRFIVYAHQSPDSGAFDLAKRVPGLLSTGNCPDA